MGNALISFLLICVSGAVPVALAVFAYRQLGSPYGAPSMRTPRVSTVTAMPANPAQQPAPSYAPVRQHRRRAWTVSLGRAVHGARSPHLSS